MANERQQRTPLARQAQPTEPAWSVRRRPSSWMALGLVWGFAEGTLFFIVPDVLICAAAILEPRQGMRVLFSSVAGALAAGLLMFSWATRQPEQSLAAVESVPFVKPWMTERTERNFEQLDIGAIYVAAVSGIPYKLNAVIAPQALPARRFLLHTGPARGYRFLLGWAVAAGAGLALRKLLGQRPDFRWAIALVGAFWALNYAIYWSII